MAERGILGNTVSRRVFVRVGAELALGGAASLAIGCSKEVEPEAPRLFIVDQLSLTDDGGDEFLYSTGFAFQRAGFQVARIPAGDVYVERFRELALYKPRVLIIRSHTTSSRVTETGLKEDNVVFFTSQLWDDALYQEEVRDGLLAKVRFLPGFANEGKGPYFGVRPPFIEKAVKGKFSKGTTVVASGCDSLKNDTMADAFFEKGVAAYFGWKGEVTADHTDGAVRILAEYMIQRNILRPQQIVEVINDQLGPDPVYGGVLAVKVNPNPKVWG